MKEIEHRIIKISHDHPVILFDGICILCNNSIQWLIKRDSKGLFRFSALQSFYSDKSSKLRLDTVILAHKGQIFEKSDAVIMILRLLGNKYKYLAFMSSIFPKIIRNYMYDIVAKYRYRWFGQYDSCILPTKDVKSRFI